MTFNPDTTDAEGRVLDAFTTHQWRLLSDILNDVSMDTSTCLHTLKALVRQGVLQRGTVKRQGRGKRPHAYRLVMRGNAMPKTTAATYTPSASPYRYTLGLTQDDVERLVRGEVPPAVQDTLISLLVSTAETPAEAIKSMERRRQR